jgi:predicted AlkP superfamily phosphohydrolase/phosphomutase
VQGREAQGIVTPQAYEATRDELAAALEAIPGPDATPLETQVFKPESIYREVRGIAPDLMVYFGDLHWRSVGSLGHGQYYTLENDTGPDDANHAMEGMFVLYAPGRSAGGQLEGCQLMDIAPTILQHMDVKIPAAMQGHVIHA